MHVKENKEMGENKIRDNLTDRDHPNNSQNQGKVSRADHTSIKNKKPVSTIHTQLNKFSNLPISILKRLRSYETLLLVINLTGIVLTGYIFFTLTNQGL